MGLSALHQFWQWYQCQDLESACYCYGNPSPTHLHSFTSLFALNSLSWKCQYHLQPTFDKQQCQTQCFNVWKNWNIFEFNSSNLWIGNEMIFGDFWTNNIWGKRLDWGLRMDDNVKHCRDEGKEGALDAWNVWSNNAHGQKSGRKRILSFVFFVLDNIIKNISVLEFEIEMFIQLTAPVWRPVISEPTLARQKKTVRIVEDEQSEVIFSSSSGCTWTKSATSSFIQWTITTNNIGIISDQSS